ncbi:MAG: sulfotransferase, partial [Gemmatimonadetes bacterium]|nr:sulfotransferase [Gemmatimonadota bacterium]
MARILYIAGYGRSGSTILSAILGAHASMIAVGELTFGHDDWRNPLRRCSCGQEYAACGFWGELLRREPRLLSARVAAEVRRVERLASPVWLGAGWVRRARRELYRDIQQRLVDLIVERSGKSVVVDASKSARLAAARTVALARLAGHEVYVLHLVRDGRATLASLLRTGSNWLLEGHVRPLPLPALRAVVGWTRSNLCAALLRACHGRDRYLRMRYEDFVADPVTSVRRIGAFVGTDMEPLVDRLRTGSTFPVGHVVGGNRVRFEGDVTLRTTTAGLPAPRLTLAERCLFVAVGGWLNRLYGYAPHADPRAP